MEINLKILKRIEEEEKKIMEIVKSKTSFKEIVEKTGLSQITVSKRIWSLYDKGMVSMEREKKKLWVWLSEEGKKILEKV